MPAASVDTFFACALMVLLVLSAMASTSKLLYPYMNYAVDKNVAERYKQISRYLLLNAGTPSDWGEGNQITPTTFGIAKTGSDESYDLDIDKVTRLNSENAYAITYAKMFSILKMPDISFGIEIKPMFEVTINLTATYAGTNETIYQFEILTVKHGVPIPADLKCYSIAEDYLETANPLTSSGRAYVNTTISSTVRGPALIAVLARSVYQREAVSFNSYSFSHGSAKPEPDGTFLRFGLLNHTLVASFAQSNVTLLKTWAFTFDHNSTLSKTASDNQSVTYDIPRFADSSPIIIVLTGTNSTTFFTERIVYPQIPLQTGADFATLKTRAKVSAYTYSVTIDSAIYECTVWIGGLRD